MIDEDTFPQDSLPEPEEIINPAQWGDHIICRRIAWAVSTHSPHRIWSYGGLLVELDPLKGRCRALTRQSLKGIINRAVRLIRESSHGGVISRMTIAISARYMDPLLTSPAEYGIRELRGIRHCPYLTPSGRLVTSPGYDEETGEWLVWEGDPIAPEAMTSETAGEWLSTLFHDFPFASKADRQHALGLLLLTMMRPAISGPTPMHLITSTGGGSGKTYFAQLFGLLMRGEYVQSIELDEWSSEARRQLTGVMAQTPDIVFLDNLSTGSTVGGAQLHHYLTARGEIAVRPVGGQTMNVPVRCVWVGTVNNPDIDPEQTRRTIPIHLERRLNRDFLIEDLHGWVLEHRAEILSALGWVIQQWLEAQRPTHSRRPLPSFVEWSHAVGGCVAHLMAMLGEDDHWLNEGHRPTAARPEWEELADLWPSRTDSADPAWISSNIILELLDQYDLIHFSEAIASGSTRGRQTRLGRLLMQASRTGVEGAEDVEVSTRMGPRRREYLLRRRAPDPEPPLFDVATSSPAEESSEDEIVALNTEWERELSEMAERGVLVDAEKWDEAVTDYRKRFIAEEPDGEVAQERARNLNAYASAVALQARCGDGRVRACWNPDGAWTTRITAHSPPLQAITKSGLLRAAVVAPPEHKLIIADWDHSHLRIAAGRSQDANMLADLAIGRDPHQLVGDHVAAGVEDPEMRRRIGKTVNFAALNLCSARRLRAILEEYGLRFELQEAQDFLNSWYERYPRLAAWQQRWGNSPSWRTPFLRREVCVPTDSRGIYPARVIAGILQSIEADALRYVLARSHAEMECRYGARIVMAVHDEVIWEVHECAAIDASRAASSLMRGGLSLVSLSAPASATVLVRDRWGTGLTQEE